MQARSSTFSHRIDKLTERLEYGPSGKVTAHHPRRLPRTPGDFGSADSIGLIGICGSFFASLSDPREVCAGPPRADRAVDVLLRPDRPHHRLEGACLDEGQKGHALPSAAAPITAL